jgi:DNA-binding transcriptional MerR regulator
MSLLLNAMKHSPLPFWKAMTLDFKRFKFCILFPMEKKTFKTTDRDTFTINEIAIATGLPESTLRYYEKVGLISPIPRGERSGHRIYPASSLVIIDGLACLRASGLNLEEMRLALAFWSQGDETISAQKALFQKHVERLDHELEMLSTRRAYLSAKVACLEAKERGDQEAAQRFQAQYEAVATTLKEQHR